MNAYQGFIDEFLLPRYQELPEGVRHIFLAAFNAEIEAMLRGRSRAEVDPANFIQALLNKGLII